MGDQEQKTKEVRIGRLRQRVDSMQADPKLAAILKAILDLLADEL